MEELWYAIRNKALDLPVGGEHCACVLQSCVYMQTFHLFMCVEGSEVTSGQQYQQC